MTRTLQLPLPSIPVIDPRSGLMTKPWRDFFAVLLEDRAGGYDGTIIEAGSGIAVADGRTVSIDPADAVAWSGQQSWRPAASVTPTTNGEVVMQLTSNTSLTFKAKGSDGTVRSGSVTLS